jgi:hypothetical protein
MAPVSAVYRLIFLGPVAVMTTPVLSVFDRGNNVGITVGLMAWAIWAWRSERWVWCGVALAAAAALKGYPIAVLVVPLALRRYKFAFLVATGAVAANLLVLAFYSGGFSRNLREVIPAIKGGTGATNMLYSWSLYSVVPKTVGLFAGRAEANSLLVQTGALVWLPSLMYLLGVFFVIRRGRVPQWCWGALALASVQLLIPLSYVYTTAWAVVAGVWYAMGCLVGVPADVRTADSQSGYATLRIALLVALTVTLAPSTFSVIGAEGFETPLARYLSPVAIAGVLCIAVAQSALPLRSASPELLAETSASSGQSTSSGTS